MINSTIQACILSSNATFSLLLDSLRYRIHLNATHNSQKYHKTEGMINIPAYVRHYFLIIF